MDLDGTFLSPDGSVSEINRNAVESLTSASIPVVFATGRPVRCLDVLDDVANVLTSTVATNGAVLFDHADGRVVERYPLTRETLRQVVAGCRRVLPTASFALECSDGFGFEPSYAHWPATDQDPAARCVDSEWIVDQHDALKLLVRCPDRGTHEAYLQLTEMFGDMVSVSHSAASNFGPVEIAAHGVSKASALSRFCRTRGIGRKSVWAFGDMPNDLELLLWAGTARIVANAHSSMHRQGFASVGSNRESGVGRYLLSMLDG